MAKVKNIPANEAIEAINDSLPLIFDDVDDLAKLYSFIFRCRVRVKNDFGGADSDIFDHGMK